MELILTSELSLLCPAHCKLFCCRGKVRMMSGKCFFPRTYASKHHAAWMFAPRTKALALGPLVYTSGIPHTESECGAKRKGGRLGRAWMAQLLTQQKCRERQKHFKNTTTAIFFLLEPKAFDPWFEWAFIPPPLKKGCSICSSPNDNVHRNDRRKPLRDTGGSCQS